MSFSASVTDLIEASNAPLTQCAEHWVRVPLAEIASVVNGFPWKSEFFNQREGIPVVRIRDVTTGATETRYSGPIVDGYLLQDRDLLVGMDGDFNVRLWRGGPALLNQRVCKVTLDERFLLKDLLFKILPGYLDLINAETHSVTVKHLSSKTLLELPVPLPPVPEQRRIVAQIDRLSARSKRAREELERVRALVSRYREAVLNAAFCGVLTTLWRAQNDSEVPSVLELQRLRRDAVIQRNSDLGRNRQYKDPVAPRWMPEFALPTGWRWASVDSVTKLIQYGTSAKTNSSTDGVPVIRMGNIQDGVLDRSDLRYLPHEHDEFPRLLLDQGDMLFNRTNSFELVGKSAVYEGDKPESFASYLIRLKTVCYEPKLLAYYLNSAIGRQWVASVASQQVGQANVNGTKLSELGVPFMSLDEQREIVRRIEHSFAAIDRLAAEATSARKLLDRLDQAVLAKAFRGELVPQDPNDEPASVLLDRIRTERAAAPAPKRGRRPKITKA